MIDYIISKYCYYVKKRAKGDNDLEQEIWKSILKVKWQKYFFRFSLLKTIVDRAIERYEQKVKKNASVSFFDTFKSKGSEIYILKKLEPYVTKRQYKILELLYIWGYKKMEIADILKVSAKTIERELKALRRQEILDIIIGM